MTGVITNLVEAKSVCGYVCPGTIGRTGKWCQYVDSYSKMFANDRWNRYVFSLWRKSVKEEDDWNVSARKWCKLLSCSLMSFWSSCGWVHEFLCQCQSQFIWQHSAFNALGAPTTAETDASSTGDQSWFLLRSLLCWSFWLGEFQIIGPTTTNAWRCYVHTHRSYFWHPSWWSEQTFSALWRLLLSTLVQIGADAGCWLLRSCVIVVFITFSE